MRKNTYLHMIAIAAVVALCACGNKNNNNTANNTPPPNAPTGETKEITVDAKNFQFTPSDIQLHPGDTVKLTLHNSQGVHGLAIPGLNVNIKNGETATFTVDKAGRYDFNCSIQCGAGHDNMTGTITVK